MCLKSGTTRTDSSDGSDKSKVYGDFDLTYQERNIIMHIRPYLLLLVCFLMVGNSCRQTNQPPTSKSTAAMEASVVAPKGFVPLFNGINLDGWNVKQDENQDWQVINGVIDCDPHDGKGDRNLWTNGSYDDFELLVEWCIKKSPYINRTAKIILSDGTYKKDESGKETLVEVPNTDSGIFLRGRHKSQVNIWCWPVGSGEVWGYRTDPTFSPKVRAGVTPKVRADRPIGQWNTFHIIMKGDHLTVRLNGKLILNKAQLPGIPAQGPIALQHHGDRKDGEWGASFMQFRNIFIKELNQSPSQ
ncbi:MAG: 3-keto-disaccharide hydrolase [Planctomycetota bacterium]